MKALRFHQLDVFTDRPLCGNPLAVFPDATGLDTDLMQALAREMNLSETTFVLPSDEADLRVRFFTPTREIPLAGHPTVGTWWLVAELGLLDLPTDGFATVTQETGAGILPVEIELREGRPVRVMMTQVKPRFGRTVTDTVPLEGALGAQPGQVVAEPPPCVVSTALPQMIIQMDSPEALESLPSGGAGAALVNLLREYGTDCAMCYVRQTPERYLARMFAPGLGVPEDPATGSAAGALGAYLAERHLLDRAQGEAEITVIQGTEIRRPSAITVLVTSSEKDTLIRVGGTAVHVIEGSIRL